MQYNVSVINFNVPSGVAAVLRHKCQHNGKIAVVGLILMYQAACKHKIQKITIVVPFRLQYYGSVTNINVPGGCTPARMSQTTNIEQQTTNNKQQKP